MPLYMVAFKWYNGPMLAMKRKIFWLGQPHPNLVENIIERVAEHAGATPEHSAVIRAVSDCIAEWSNPNHPWHRTFVQKTSEQHTLRGLERQPRNYYVWPKNFVELRTASAQLTAELGSSIDESMLIRLALEEIATRFDGGDSSFISGFSRKVQKNIAPKGRASKTLGGVPLPMASD
jgi:hypothetical protein